VFPGAADNPAAERGRKPKKILALNSKPPKQTPFFGKSFDDGAVQPTKLHVKSRIAELSRRSRHVLHAVVFTKIS
jgi:hypothetical protein